MSFGCSSPSGVLRYTMASIHEVVFCGGFALVRCEGEEGTLGIVDHHRPAPLFGTMLCRAQTSNRNEQEWQHICLFPWLCSAPRLTASARCLFLSVLGGLRVRQDTLRLLTLWFAHGGYEQVRGTGVCICMSHAATVGVDRVDHLFIDHSRVLGCFTRVL